tara:strand:+ start:705 stop:866 length:162 start_codon:yes stop_codon:yes gene_type:complete
MKFIFLLKHLIVSIWKNVSPLQAAIISAFLIVIIIILIISIVQVIVPFTYIAI